MHAHIYIHAVFSVSKLSFKLFPHTRSVQTFVYMYTCTYIVVTSLLVIFSFIINESARM